MLTRMSLLIALNIILTRMQSIRVPIGGVEAFRIGIGSFPVVFAGIFLGPLAGGIVGAVGDFCGYFVNNVGGGYVPLITINAALRGIIPGLLISFFSMGRKSVGIVPLFLAVAVTLPLTDILLLPYILEFAYGLSRVVTVPPWAMQSAVKIPLYTILLHSLGRVTERILTPESGKGAMHLTTKIW